MTRPSARCYPRGDCDFEHDVAIAIAAEGGDPDRVLIRLQTTYPHIRIAVRSALANLESASVWYCYRDGKLIVTSDGAGAMRLWTTLERESRRSLDLLEASDRLMRRSQMLVARQARTVVSPHI
jgi:hypothetical protein